MSAVLRALAERHPDKIAGFYKDLDGWWVHLKYGWQCGNAHQVHEMTVREVVSAFGSVEPCGCRECRTHGEEWDDLDIETGKMRVYRRAGKSPI